MKIRQARDHLSNRADQSSPIKSLMWPVMERRKMILAQPLYLWGNGGNIEGGPRRMFQTSLPSLSFLSLASQPSCFFRAPPLLNAKAQIGYEHCQDDQPKSKKFEHGAPGLTSIGPNAGLA
jgi:hypothetical protein